MPNSWLKLHRLCQGRCAWPGGSTGTVRDNCHDDINSRNQELFFSGLPFGPVLALGLLSL